jgi:hypothetical protein
MAKKKRKITISSYLANMGNQISKLEWNAEQSGRKVDVDGLQRQSINGLLRQLDFVDSIQPDERPRDGIKRMHVYEADSIQKKKLDEILRWFERQRRFVAVSSSSRTNVIYRGKVYTKEEYEALEAKGERR